MNLAALTEGLECRLLQGTADKDVKALIYFSDKAVPGCAFFAIAGTEDDGCRYIGDALDRGAGVIVTSRKHLPEEIPETLQSAAAGQDITVLWTPDVRKALAHMSCIFYRHPCRNLLTIGVTGTKGKTSTTFMIRDILEAAGIRTGLLGTVQNGWGDCFEEADRTTPQSCDVQQWCRRMADGGCRVLVMEVSSQGLKQSRADGILFDIAVFTNLSPDHIGPGEHEDFGEYAFWKSRLFARCRKAVMNCDDIHWRRMLPEDGVKVRTFGQKTEADYVCENLQLIRTEQGPGVSFCMEGHRILLNLAGAFNGINAAGAIAAVRQLGIPWSTIQEALAGVKIPGRVEPVDTGGKTSVLVDYAHNGVSLRQILTDLRQYAPRRLILVFGCGGGRDRSRRFEMGRAAAELADFTVVTSDNPRRENPEEIINDITGAMEAWGAEKDRYLVISGRAQAIRTAVELGGPDDIVLIAGKGHETCQLTGDTKIHFDDREIVRNMGETKL